jgi:WD40 repeat protein
VVGWSTNTERILLCPAREDGTIRVWELASDRLVRTLKDHSGFLRGSRSRVRASRREASPGHATTALFITSTKELAGAGGFEPPISDPKIAFIQLTIRWSGWSLRPVRIQIRDLLDITKTRTVASTRNTVGVRKWCRTPVERRAGKHAPIKEPAAE